MKRYQVCGFIVLMVLLLALPVAGWHILITKTGPEGSVCSTGDSFIYSISACNIDSEGRADPVLRVNDTLPAGIEYIQGSSVTEPGASVNPQLDTFTNTLTWDFTNVPWHSCRNISFKARPADPGLISATNTAETWVNKVSAGARWEKSDVSNTVTTTFSNTVCAIPTPEFPTIALPAACIIGMIGVVLFIRRTKQN